MADAEQKPLNEKPVGEPAPSSEGNEYDNVCGIIRPISPMGYPEGHWEQVHEILTEAIKNIGLETRLVSQAAEISIIQKTIIQNLYNCPILICDISGKNPNVMFELGLRLAFDKPTIIIKDKETNCNFDIEQIEYLEYPSSLHYWEIKEFEKDIKTKIIGTLKKAKEDNGYSPFLKNFGRLVPAKLGEKQIPEMGYVQEMLSDMNKSIMSLSNKLDYYTKQQKGSVGDYGLSEDVVSPPPPSSPGTNLNAFLTAMKELSRKNKE